MFWTIIGFIAASLTTFAFIPQIFRILETKSVKDVSALTLAQLSLGVTLWTVYGVARKDIVLIIANSVTLVSLAVLLILYFKHRKR